MFFQSNVVVQRKSCGPLKARFVEALRDNNRTATEVESMSAKLAVEVGKVGTDSAKQTPIIIEYLQQLGVPSDIASSVANRRTFKEIHYPVVHVAKSIASSSALISPVPANAQRMSSDPRSLARPVLPQRFPDVSRPHRPLALRGLFCWRRTKRHCSVLAHRKSLAHGQALLEL